MHVPVYELNKGNVIQSTGASKIKKLKKHALVGEETVDFFLKKEIRQVRKNIVVFKFKSICKIPE
jgi:hypothetical protein